MNKLLYLLLIIASLFAYSCAVNETDSAGKINGKSISMEEFYSAYRGHYAMFGYQNGRSPDKDEKQKIFNDTWVNITRSLILRDYYQKYKINVSTREAIDTLSNTIPAHILASRVFQTDGKFDKKLYIQSLLTDRPENLGALRKQYQDYLIPNQKLQARLIERELISKSEARQITKILGSSADITLNIFDPQKLEVPISDNEISSYYQENLNKYRLKPHYRLAYCNFPVIPDEEDHLQSKALADSIHSLLLQGKTAEEILQARTKDTGMLSLMDHGYQKTLDLPAAVSGLFATMPDAGYSDPLREDKGWVIYHKVQSTKTLTLYRSIRIQSLPRSSNLASPETVARRLMDLALSIGLREAADEFGYGYNETEKLNPDSLSFVATDIQGQLMKKLKSAAPGTIFEPIYSAELSSWLLIEVLENQSKQYQSLDDLKDSIKTELASTRRNEQNMLLAKQWIAAPSPANSLNLSVEKLSGVNSKTLWHSQTLTNIYYRAMKAFMDKTAPPVVEQNNLLIVPLVTNAQFSKTDISDQQIRDTFINTLPANWFTVWLNALVEQAKVQIIAVP